MSCESCQPYMTLGASARSLTKFGAFDEGGHFVAQTAFLKSAAACFAQPRHHFHPVDSSLTHLKTFQIPICFSHLIDLRTTSALTATYPPVQNFVPLLSACLTCQHCLNLPRRLLVRVSTRPIASPTTRRRSASTRRTATSRQTCSPAGRCSSRILWTMSLTATLMCLQGLF